MASVAPAYSSYEFMRVTFPAPYVAHLEINRPSKLNAFSRPVWLEFGQVCRQLSDDSDVRVIVLSGAGERAFTAGLDVTAASTDGPLSGEGANLDPARKAKALRGHIEEFQDSITQLEKCEKRTCHACYYYLTRRSV
jgi:delta(3,5)-delta(2,4)-dienoyl-CoA isomerase